MSNVTHTRSRNWLTHSVIYSEGRSSVDRIQTSKAVVREFYDALDGVGPDQVGPIIRRHTGPGFTWRGTHPFTEPLDAQGAESVFWRPFLTAFTRVQRREDVFIAGLNSEGDESDVWVCSMGHLLGLFDEDWLHIPHTGRMAFLRYVEFHRVVDGHIAETVFYCDLIDLMLQAGLRPLPEQTGVTTLTPGPRTHDGLHHDHTDPAEGALTRTLIEAMISDLLGDGLHSSQETLAKTWHDGMIWWGPAGIGATYTQERYERQHQGPFRAGLESIESHDHQCAIAEGNFGGFFGWPSLTVTPRGGWLGLPATAGGVEMRLVDIYRRDGDRLAENWIFIDILGFLFDQGLDVLGRMAALTPAGSHPRHE